MTFRPTGIVIHHTVTSEHATPADINRIHKARGFSGIGYHALVHRARGDDWVIGDGRDDENMGAHAKGANSSNLGVALAGNYEHTKPAEAAVAMLVGQCLAWCIQYDIDPGRIVAHNQAGSTATVCPGLIPVGRIRDAVRSAMPHIPEH